MALGSPSNRVLERLTARDLRVLMLWLLTGLAGASIAYRYFFLAFPEAAVQFQVTRAQALVQARDFTAAQGGALAGYDSTVVFDVNDEEKTYLEREVGLEQANRLMSSQVSVWSWSARFFKPLQKEEFRVAVDPGGRIVGYSHILEERAPGARLEREAAEARAEQFLRDTLHSPLDNYTFLPEEANSTARPNRTDWSFTWERIGFRAAEAPYRLQVVVQGDNIGGYSEFLKVPEGWQRSFERLRSSNNFIETIALIPYAVLLGAALSLVMIMGSHGQLQWTGALKLGLFVMALYFLMQMNQWPLTRAGYDTNSSYASFIAGQRGLALGSSFLLSLLVVIAVLPGETLYRAGQPDRLRLGSAFTLTGLQTKEFFRSGVIGLCLAAAHIGYVVLFYVAGRRLGVWAPQDLQYSDTLSTALPWIYPLTIGIYAATSEEFLFRLFSVRFILRTTKSQWLAVLLPAFAWGFLHSNYPQEPAYVRGIEVGLVGIVAGLVMLRWGIVATLIWHYTVDAFLISLSLMRSPDLYSRVSGALVGFGAFIPVGIAGVLYLARGGFVDGTALLNRAEPVAAPSPPAVAAATRPEPIYEPMTRPALVILGVCGALGLAVLFTANPQRVGSFIRFSLDASQAEARADEVLRQQQVDPSAYRRAATIQYRLDDGLVNEFLRRGVGVAGANRIYRDEVPSAFWTVRYFHDAQKEEYLVVLRPDGALHAVHHTLPEEAPGANLSKQEAQALADAYLENNKGLDLTQWRVVESDSQKLPARTDHTFTWEETAPLTPATAGRESAHRRVQLQVRGAEVTGYRIFIHVPEDWLRKQQQTSLARTAQGIGLVALLGAFVVSVFVIFFRNLKNGLVASVPWRRLAGWTIPVLAGALAMFITSEPQYLASYSTQEPFAFFAATRLIGLAFGAVLYCALALFLFGLGWFFLARLYGDERLPGWRGMPALYYRDALLLGLGGSLAILAISRLPDLLASVWAVPRSALQADLPQNLEFLLPAVHVAGGAVARSFLGIGLLALTLGFALYCVRSSTIQALLLGAVAILTAPLNGSAGEFSQKAFAGFATLVFLWWAARKLVRFNLLGYFLVAMLLSLAPAAAEFLRQPNSFYRANGWAVIAVLAALVLWPLVAWQWKRQVPTNRGTSIP